MIREFLVSATEQLLFFFFTFYFVYFHHILLLCSSKSSSFLSFFVSEKIVDKMTDTINNYHKQFELIMNLLKEEVSREHSFFFKYFSMLIIFSSWFSFVHRARNPMIFFVSSLSDWISMISMPTTSPAPHPVE
jgi:hypothetical protein